MRSMVHSIAHIGHSNREDQVDALDHALDRTHQSLQQRRSSICARSCAQLHSSSAIPKKANFWSSVIALV
jgi:hypothetical protein